MKPCRECGHEISELARACPNCGTPFPAKEKWDGWGYEYKSKTTLLGFPLIHISFKRDPHSWPVPARGVIAIGQFACGLVTISQFGVGLVSLGQFEVGWYSVAQFGLAYNLIAQFGICLNAGYGQAVTTLGGLLHHFS